MGLHDGHRARVRQRVLKEGLLHLPVHNVLEILLFFSIPRGDTNALAHRILERYHGDLANVTEAPIEDLMAIEGVGENTAFLLKILPEIAAYYRLSRIKDTPALNTREALQEYFIPLFYGKHNEELHLVSLDANMRPINDTKISEGSVTASAVNVRRIVETAVSSHAAAVILAHNHPSGLLRPSVKDSSATRSAAEALALIGIRVMDHVIVAEEGLYSFREAGILPYPDLDPN